ncbi:MAG: TolC family protein [Flavobacteriales bacterium]|nr:TolC family protein [Flavobacteriales bacterium]
MSNKLLFVFSLLLIGVTGTLQAQRKYSLEECIVYARENNLTVKKSELNLEMSEDQKSSQFGNFLPDFNLNTAYSYNNGFSIDPTTNRVLNNESNSLAFNATSQWNIFTGLSNLNSYRKAKFDLLSARYNLEQMKDNISLQVANAYLEIVLNKEFLKVAEDQVALSLKEVDRMQRFVDAGQKTKGDLYESQATLANDEQQHVAVENNLVLSMLALTQLLQIEYNKDFDILEEDFPIPSLGMMEKSNDEVYEKALKTQYLIQSYENQIFSAQKDLSIAKGSYSPSLSLVYQFSSRFLLEKNRAVITGSTQQVPIGYVGSTGEVVVTDMAANGSERYPFWDQMNDGKNHYVGLNLRIPLFNRFNNRTSVRIKRLQLQQAELEMEIEKNKLRQSIEKAQADANAALKTFKSGEKALESIEEAFKYAQQKRDVGSISEYDYNQSRTRFVKAQSTMLQSKYDFIFKVKILEYYFGERFEGM